MGGRMSRNKGKRAERQVIELLQPVIDHVYAEANKRAPILQRNTLQSDFGGHDISGLEWLSLEVKHCEQWSRGRWWQQCTEQAAKWGIRRTLTPVLFYRRNGVPFSVMMHKRDYDVHGYYEHADHLVDIAVEDFQIYFYRRLRAELGLR